MHYRPNRSETELARHTERPSALSETELARHTERPSALSET